MSNSLLKEGEELNRPRIRYDAEPLLKVRDLTVEFRVPRGILRAVDEMDIDVYEGEVLGLVGESGCGKSVFAHAVLNIVDVNGYIRSGKVIFDGVDVLELDEDELREFRWKNIAIVFQGAFSSLNPVLKVVDHMIDTYIAHGEATREEIRERARKLLEQVRLDADVVLDRYPHELSGGMKQRVVTAMAMLLEPRLLILDEPTSALDILTQKFLVTILRNIQRKLGITMIFITHDLATIAEIADRVAVMYSGKIVELGTAEQIFYEPKHPYTKALLSAIPSIVGDVSGLKPLPGPLPDPINPPPGCRFHPRCPYAKEICKKEFPEQEKIEDGWLIACHFWREINK